MTAESDLLAHASRFPVVVSAHCARHPAPL